MAYSDWKEERKDTGGGYKGWAEDRPLGPGGESAYNPQRPEYQIDPAEMYSYRRNKAAFDMKPDADDWTENAAGISEVDRRRERFNKQHGDINKRFHRQFPGEGVHAGPGNWGDLRGPEAINKAHAFDYDEEMWGRNKKGEGFQKQPDWFTGGTPKPGFFTGQNPQEGLGL